MMTAAQIEKGHTRHSPLYSQDGTMTFLGCEHEATLLEALRAVQYGLSFVTTYIEGKPIRKATDEELREVIAAAIRLGEDEP